jgi:hypothetical protein
MSPADTLARFLNGACRAHRDGAGRLPDRDAYHGRAQPLPQPGWKHSVAFRLHAQGAQP